MTHADLIGILAARMRGDEAEAVIAYVSKLEQDDLDYYERIGIDGLVQCIRGEYADFASGTAHDIAHPPKRY